MSCPRGLHTSSQLVTGLIRDVDVSCFYENIIGFTVMEAHLPPDVSPADSRAGITIGVVTLVLTVASIAVGLRVYVRAFLIKQFGLDDCAAIASFVSLTVPSY